MKMNNMKMMKSDNNEEYDEVNENDDDGDNEKQNAIIKTMRMM